MSETINVVYSCDDKYSMLVGVSMESLFVTNQEASSIAVFVLTTKVEDNNKEKLRCIARKHDRKISFIELTDDVTQQQALKIDYQRWSIAAFARLFTPQLLPDLQRILYLDCDTIVNGSISDLWEEDLKGNTCAAVAEPFSERHKKNLGMSKNDIYYNSGVMLIDLNKWREIDAKADFVRSIQRHSGKVPYVDQGVLNEVFNRKITRLPAKYNVFTEYYDFTYDEVNEYRADQNVYSREEIEKAKRDPAIIHLVSSFLTPRPWVENSTHPYAPLWEEYCAETPWADEKKWPDSPGRNKLVLRWIFNHCPRAFSIWCARTANSNVRAWQDKRNIVETFTTVWGGVKHRRIKALSPFIHFIPIAILSYRRVVA